MKKILLSLVVLFSFLTSFEQSTGNDLTKYVYYRYTYGNRLARYKADSVLAAPLDTAYSKDGVAIIGTKLFSGNGSWWTAVAQQVSPLVDGVVSGCSVIYKTGLTVTVLTPCVYNLAGGTYSLSAPVDVTAATADPSLTRQDAIAVTTGSTATSVTGTPAANPEVPTVNGASQLFLTSILVGAGATTLPQFGQVIIRDVNYAAGEWFMSGAATFDSLYATNPFHATNSVRLTGAASGQFFQFNSRAGALFTKSNYNYIILNIRNNNTLLPTRTLTISMWNGATQIGGNVSLATFGYNAVTLASYQQIAIPISGFTGSNFFTALRITNTGTGGTVDVQFDYIQLQANSASSGGSQNAITNINTNSGSAVATQSNDAINILGTGVVTVTATGKTVTIGASGFAATLGFVNVVDYGADSTGTRGSALGFINAVATGKNVYVPPGRYLINGIDSAVILKAGQTIFGLGDKSVLKTTTNGATTTLATAMNFIVLPNGNCTVRDLKFVGNGATTYVFPWTTQNGVWVYSDRNQILNITCDSLRGAGVLGVDPGLLSFYNNRLVNASFYNSTCGTFNYAGSEYWVVNNIRAEGNDIAINEWGANNYYNGGSLRDNTKSIFASGNGGNTDHFAFVNMNINHSIGDGITIQNVVVGVHFDNDNIFASIIKISQSNNVVFNGGVIGTGSNVTVDATGTTKPTVFAGPLLIYGAPTFTETNLGKIIFQNTNTDLIASGISTNGSVTTGYVAKTATYAILSYDHTINCTANSFTVTLPTAVSIAGKVYVIKNTGVGTITLATTSAQTIDGSAPGTVVAGAVTVLQSTGANWIKIN